MQQIINNLFDYKSIPESYKIFRVHLYAFQKWDNVATYMVNRAYIVTNEDELILVGDSVWNYSKIAKYHAALRYGRFFKALFESIKIPIPSERIEIIFHDLMPFLVVSKQAHPPTSAVRWYRFQFSIAVNVPIWFWLGDKEFPIEMHEFFRHDTKEDGFRVLYNQATMTLEQQGITNRKLFKQQMKTRKEMRLC